MGSKTERLIVVAHHGMPMFDALRYAQEVVHTGRISNGGYCYVMQFADGTLTYARRNSASDRIDVGLREGIPWLRKEKG